MSKPFNKAWKILKGLDECYRCGVPFDEDDNLNVQQSDDGPLCRDCYAMYLRGRDLGRGYRYTGQDQYLGLTEDERSAYYGQY